MGHRSVAGALCPALPMVFPGARDPRRIQIGHLTLSAASGVHSAPGASLIPASGFSRCEVTALSALLPLLGEGGRDPRSLPALVIPVFIVLNQRCCWGQVTPYRKFPLSGTNAGKMATVPHLHARWVEAWVKIFVRFTEALPFRLWSPRHCGVLSCCLLTAGVQD